MKGEIVLVSMEEATGIDPYGIPIYDSIGWSTVENVLVAPGPRSDMPQNTSPDAVKVIYTLLFPKTFSDPLMGRQINVRGDVYGVIGSPGFYSAENTPTDWWMPVEVGVVDDGRKADQSQGE